MEARFARILASTLAISFCFLAASRQAGAAGYKTTNFVVSAPDARLAKEIGDQAEVYRKQLAEEWLGKDLPPWSKPCPIHADVAPNKGAGGATSFVFQRGEVFGWNMNIQGSRERILDSVLPHEVTHTIFASYFRQPLPRWADEGACTTVEHPSEVSKQERNLIQFLRSGRGIPFSDMFAMKEYPKDVMPLYAQGHSLAEWLIENRGRKAFLEFVGDGMQDENWPRAVREHYGFNNLLEMQTAWNEWVKQGRPHITPATSTLAVNNRGTSASGGRDGQPIVRTQSPDNLSPAASVAASRTTPAAPVTVASARPSVYAEVAKRAQLERARAAESAEPPAALAKSGPSVYDASRGNATLRR
jgi:hypothetical protein